MTRTDLAADRARRLENAADLVVALFAAMGWAFVVVLPVVALLGYVLGFWPGVGL